MKRASAPGYDLFKLVVTLILTAILILMLLRGCAVTTPPAALLPTEIVIASTSTQMTVPSSTPPPIPSPTSAPASPTPSPAPTESPAPTAAPTGSPTPAPAVPATPAASQGSSACNAIVPSRLSLGQQARVLRNLNMRQEPAISSPIIQTNLTGATLEIIGGPVCTPQGNSAYLWWNVQRTDGSGGWSAETPLNEAAYFLEPLP